MLLPELVTPCSFALPSWQQGNAVKNFHRLARRRKFNARNMFTANNAPKINMVASHAGLNLERLHACYEYVRRLSVLITRSVRVRMVDEKFLRGWRKFKHAEIHHTNQ